MCLNVGALTCLASTTHPTPSSISSQLLILQVFLMGSFSLRNSIIMTLLIGIFQW